MTRKFNSIICRFFAPHSEDYACSLLHGPIPTYYSNDAIKFSYHFLLSYAHPDFFYILHKLNENNHLNSSC